MSLRFGLSVVVTMLVGTICFVAGNPNWITAWALLLFLFMVFYDALRPLEDEVVMTVAGTSLVLVHVAAFMGSYVSIALLGAFWITATIEFVKERRKERQNRLWRAEESRRLEGIIRILEERRRDPEANKVNWQKEGF